jgi:hypothetical protein
VFWPYCREVVVQVAFAPEPRLCAPLRQGHNFNMLHAGTFDAVASQRQALLAVPSSLRTVLRAVPNGLVRVSCVR